MISSDAFKTYVICLNSLTIQDFKHLFPAKLHLRLLNKRLAERLKLERVSQNWIFSLKKRKFYYKINVNLKFLMHIEEYSVW